MRTRQEGQTPLQTDSQPASNRSAPDLRGEGGWRGWGGGGKGVGGGLLWDRAGPQRLRSVCRGGDDSARLTGRLTSMHVMSAVWLQLPDQGPSMNGGKSVSTSCLH
ncbi:hypothetical protein JZ751_017990 [Albula glossodonta]|uniref:Uncharacterized protein n=1 Tax=Albula glossodonta TaxID=121402 RepID=A0A8T2PPV9_9TELE|nr:hypothetical protein JZ751_017990 [Albula glossodonta]